MAKRKDLWAFWANAHGPSFKNPVKVTWCPDSRKWWDRTGNFDVAKPGLTNEGWICFAHPDLRRVSDFAEGFRAAQNIVLQFASACNNGQTTPSKSKTA